MCYPKRPYSKCKKNKNKKFETDCNTTIGISVVCFACDSPLFLFDALRSRLLPSYFSYRENENVDETRSLKFSFRDDFIRTGEKTGFLLYKKISSLGAGCSSLRRVIVAAGQSGSVFSYPLLLSIKTKCNVSNMPFCL